MKRLLVGSLAILINSVLSIHQTSATVAPLQPGNEIQNPSFETIGGSGPTLFAPWGLDTKGGTAAAIAADTSTAASGPTSARIDVSQTNGAFWGVQLDQAVPTAAGHAYQISLWARASSPRALPIALQQAAAPYAVYISAAAALTAAWQQFTFAYAATATDPAALLHLDAGVATGSIWVDDVSVADVGPPDATPTPPPSPTLTATSTATPSATSTPPPTATPTPTATATATASPTARATSTPPPTATAASGTVPGNEIQNPSFETIGGSGPGLFGPWWLDAKGGTAASLGADRGTSVSGFTSARIDVSQTNGYYWGVQLDQAAPTAAGREYLISFWAKASSPRALPIALQQAAAPYTVYVSPAAALTATWQRFTFAYNATIGDPGAVLHLDAGVATGSIWVDDVSVTATDGTGAPLPTPVPYAGSYFRGVNLKGGDQGSYGSSPDTFGSGATLDWLKGKGFATLRVPFSWAHLQPALGGPLDPAYLGLMDSLVAGAKARGMRVAFVPLQRPGSPYPSLVDLWTRLAAHYAGERAIWGYDLMNEPDGDAWNISTVPAIVAAIRAVDMAHTIVVETATGGWGQNWAAHLEGLPVQDPANNLLYETHFYFDTPANGQYPNGTAFDVPNGDLNIGVERAADFVNWCRANGVRCYAGEYGIPGGWTGGVASCTNGTPQTDPRWLTVLDRFLGYLDQNHIAGTYWEAGPFGDVNDLGPTCSGQDRPQMAILQRHLGTG